MPMPCGPGTVFIAIHADLPLDFLKALLDRPAYGGGLNQFGKRDLFGRIGDGEFDLSIVVLSKKEPLPIAYRQSVARQMDANAGHFCDDRPLGTLGNNHGIEGQTARRGDFRYAFRLGLPGQYLGLAGTTATALIGRQTDPWLFGKNLSIGLDGGKVRKTLGQGV